MHNLVIVAGEPELAERAADHFVEKARAAIMDRGTFDVALAGGSTPKAMNALLAVSPRKDRVHWESVRFFFGDERCVPPDHDDSNFRMTNESLFAPLRIEESQIFRIRGEDDPKIAAATYSALLLREMGQRPRFDLVHLGMGADGHTASIFPGTLDQIDDTKLTAAPWVEKFSTFRVTITPRVINNARSVTIETGGSGKADALAAVLEGPHDPSRYPIQLVAPTDGELLWIVDRAATANLRTTIATLERG